MELVNPCVYNIQGVQESPQSSIVNKEKIVANARDEMSKCEEK